MIAEDDFTEEILESSSLFEWQWMLEQSGLKPDNCMLALLVYYGLAYRWTEADVAKAFGCHYSDVAAKYPYEHCRSDWFTGA